MLTHSQQFTTVYLGCLSPTPQPITRETCLHPYNCASHGTISREPSPTLLSTTPLKSHTHTHTQPISPRSSPVPMFFQAHTPYECQLSGREGSVPSLPPWLVDGHHLSRLLYHLPSICASVSILSLFIRTPVRQDLMAFTWLPP